MAQTQAVTKVVGGFNPSHITSHVEPVLFNDLWAGDRFRIVGDTSGVVYTKIKHDQARRHSAESIALGEQGYGHLDDSVVAMKQTTIVQFIPV